jgi:putative hydrolase of the HAD superfamily
MNGTFMFGGDRFGPLQDYFASDRAVGGRRLSSTEVQSAVSACYAAFLHDYEDPRLTECFPSLDAFVVTHSEVPASEHEAIAKTIARHEVGKVPGWAALSIRSIAERSAVAVVSNVWAPSHHWKAELAASGVAPLLAAAIFSTEVGAIKPSAQPFLAALDAMGASPSEVLFVGDSLERDILPATKLGMSTCLVGSCVAGTVADFHAQSIAELAI